MQAPQDADVTIVSITTRRTYEARREAWLYGDDSHYRHDRVCINAPGGCAHKSPIESISPDFLIRLTKLTGMDGRQLVAAYYQRGDVMRRERRREERRRACGLARRYRGGSGSGGGSGGVDTGKYSPQEEIRRIREEKSKEVFARVVPSKEYLSEIVALRKELDDGRRGRVK